MNESKGKTKPQFPTFLSAGDPTDTHLEPHALFGQPSLVFWIVCLIDNVGIGIDIGRTGQMRASLHHIGLLHGHKRRSNKNDQPNKILCCCYCLLLCAAWGSTYCTVLYCNRFGTQKTPPTKSPHFFSQAQQKIDSIRTLSAHSHLSSMFQCPLMPIPMSSGLYSRC